MRDLDRAAVQQFVDWPTTRPGRAGPLCDRSIANALTPLRLALDAAVAEGLLDANPAEQVVLPRRRAGRAWSPRAGASAQIRPKAIAAQARARVRHGRWAPAMREGGMSAKR
jgi:site-specific recombinase XerC